MLRRTAVVLAAAAPLTWLLVATPSAYATAVSVRTDAHTATAASARTVVLRLTAPAVDAAAYWRGAPAAHVTLAFSRDGVHFGAPVDAGRDEVGEQRRNGVTYGAVRSAGGAVAVRIVSDRTLARVWVLGMADGAKTVSRHRVPVAASAAVPQPTVTSRAGWGADESLRFDSTGKEKWLPTFYASKKLIVHHTDTPNGETDPAAVASRLRSIYYYHCVTQGWGDIGYNFLIDETGTVYEGRHSRDYGTAMPTGDDSLGRGVTGAHTSGWNSGTIGIALLGTLTSQDATPAAKNALENMLAWEASRNGIDPQVSSTFVNPNSGASITTANIGGHRDYGSTECPGGIFYATLPQVRSEVAARIAAGGGTTTTPPSPAATDTTAPSTPTAVIATPGKSSVTVGWQASGDNVAVTGYEVFRSATSAGIYTSLGTTTSTSYKNGGLKSGQTYWFTVEAYDAAGNRSGRSAPVSATAK